MESVGSLEWMFQVLWWRLGAENEDLPGCGGDGATLWGDGRGSEKVQRAALSWWVNSRPFSWKPGEKGSKILSWAKSSIFSIEVLLMISSSLSPMRFPLFVCPRLWLLHVFKWFIAKWHWKSAIIPKKACWTVTRLEIFKITIEYFFFTIFVKYLYTENTEQVA